MSNLKKSLLILTLILISNSAGAEALYVRDDSYTPTGASDGSGYATAFDGWGDITWGAGAGNVGPGDTLYICGAIGGEVTNIGDDGESGNVITISLACPDAAGSVDHDDDGKEGLRINSRNYITITGDPSASDGRGSEIVDAQSGVTGPMGAGITISNLYIHSGLAAGIATSSALTGLLTIEDCYISDNATFGIIVQSGGSGGALIVRRNTITDNGTAGNQDGIFAGDGTETILIEDNIVTNQAGGTCIDVSNGAGDNAQVATVSRNYVNGCGTECYKYGNTHGIVDTYNLYNNIGVNCGTEACFLMKEEGNYNIYNNTFIETGSGKYGVIINAAGTKTVSLKNNIIKGGTFSQNMFRVQDATGLTLNINNNVYYPEDFNYGGTVSFAAWQTATGGDANSSVADPLFIQP